MNELTHGRCYIPYESLVPALLERCDVAEKELERRDVEFLQLSANIGYLHGQIDTAAQIMRQLSDGLGGSNKRRFTPTP